MATEYPVKMSVALEPVGKPWVIIEVNGQGQLQQLVVETDFNFDFRADKTARLTVQHFNKSDLDPVTAVIVKRISFFGISDPKFVWAGTYCPDYPEHYEHKIASLPGQEYLGWNGTYQLDFSIPVFTWMHQIKNFGWIYE